MHVVKFLFALWNDRTSHCATSSQVSSFSDDNNVFFIIMADREFRHFGYLIEIKSNLRLDPLI